MRLRLLLAAALLATTGCQPHLAPVEAMPRLARDGGIEPEAATVGLPDASEDVGIEEGEAADRSPSDHRRDEVARPFGRLASRTRVLTGARDAIRERRRR